MQKQPNRTKSRTAKLHETSLQRGARGLAYVEVASTELARQINRDVILELVRVRQPIARVDLARASGLQNSTVSSIVEQLLTEQWVVEGSAIRTARGRRPTLLSLNPQLALLVADVHPERATVAAVDFNGECLSRFNVTLEAGAKQGVKAIISGLKKVRERHSDKVFEGVGICLPGRINPQTNRLILAPNLGWCDYDIQGEISKALSLQTELDNDANACLLSELWFGHLDGIRNAVLLAISEGVGAAVLAEGKLIAGKLGMAGEFGHVCYDPAGPICSCGRRGCWEVFASSSAMQRTYSQTKHRASPIHAIAEIIEAARDGDPAAKTAIVEQAHAIGRGLRTLNVSLSPEVILFAGQITQSWDLVSPVLEEECRAGLLDGMTKPRLVCIRDGELAHLRGAAAVVLQRHSGYFRSSAATEEFPERPVFR